jgi:hypothetical protein
MKQIIYMIKYILVSLVLIASVTGFSSCEKNSYAVQAVDPSATWHFQADIQPIFSANCVTCHGGSRAPDLRDGKSYLALTKGGYVNTPAASSKLYTKMSGSDHASRSTEGEKLKVLYWITQGALNN